MSLVLSRVSIITQWKGHQSVWDSVFFFYPEVFINMAVRMKRISGEEGAEEYPPDWAEQPTILESTLLFEK